MDPSAEFPRAPHVFEIRVPNMIYYVGEDPFYGSEEGSLVVSSESGKGLEQARHWENAIRQALMPVTPTSSINQNTNDKCKLALILYQINLDWSKLEAFADEKKM